MLNDSNIDQYFHCEEAPLVLEQDIMGPGTERENKMRVSLVRLYLFDVSEMTKGRWQHASTMENRENGFHTAIV